MPAINRIRVNNVKYNFGTQFYDDFTMRMHGKNTLYDLANGGGKSVLMLLLLQNMIPNCTLDEKQPIEKLFRSGNGNTTIHSLVEWKLDEGDSEEGYRYMTTGFCARKAKDGAETEKDKDIASVEYFNYCIFYRDYNKNDIINLPLVKDKARVGFQELKSYLKELEHRDMSLMVRVFERKGEYQQFISRYGIHESQWEIIRGINKTEGHVRTYFENNYKTTRKVVEDLLIEEIIEKAYGIKTSKSEQGEDSMAKMLMDIKEQLTILAKKKKDIASYDHQIELISMLKDKVSSFMDLYGELGRLTGLIADICVTGEEFAKNDEEEQRILEAKRDEKRKQKNEQREKIECLKVARDKRHLEELREEEKLLAAQIEECKKREKQLEEDLNLKEGINEYLEYISCEKKYKENENYIKAIVADSDFDEEKLFTYVYNIKMRNDVLLTRLRGDIEQITEEIAQSKAKKEYQEKLLSETRLSLGIAKKLRNSAKEEIVGLSKKMSDINLSMNNLSFEDVNAQKDKLNECLLQMEDKIAKSKDTIGQAERELEQALIDKALLEKSKQETDRNLSELSQKEEEYSKAGEKYEHIKTIYGGRDEEELAGIISDRITRAVLEQEEIKKKISTIKKRIERLKEGRVIDISPEASKLINYIETRHGSTAMYGMDYISALPYEKKLEVLQANPELPYGILVRDYEQIKDDPQIGMADNGYAYVNIYDMDKIQEKALFYGDNAFSNHPDLEELVDAENIQKMIDRLTSEQRELELGLDMDSEMLQTYREDQKFLISISDGEIKGVAERLKGLRNRQKEQSNELDCLDKKINSCRILIENTTAGLAEDRVKRSEVKDDLNRLFSAEQLMEIISEKEKIVSENQENISRLSEKELEILNESDDSNIGYEEKRARLALIEGQISAVTEEWNTKYKAYYNVDREYDVLTIGDEELKARFTAMQSIGEDSIRAVEDKKALLDTIKTSMDKCMKNIEKLGVDISILRDYEFRNMLYFSDDNILYVCRKNIDDVASQLCMYENRLGEKQKEINRLEGSIEYAVSNIMDAFGSYTEEDASISEIVSMLENGENLLRRLDSEVKECDEECRRYARQQGYMIELYKDVKRIVKGDDIDLTNAKVMQEDKDKLRELFENTLTDYDRTNKSLNRANSELMKFKGTTAATLDKLGVYELAASIRDDVILPESHGQALELEKNLSSMISYIQLEKDRVEKSLVDMETIRENFVEHCIQRCLDVKTELDKLPKLSRIVSEGEVINIVGLSVPYVKEDFIRQRMSDYIDRIVAQADDYENDKDRMRFIKNSLALKKLFGVIVTDMNAIRLSLYKRERIKEQSRYLKYEEAVGSTGQSQGIYIQFLVAIINYISGMYQIGNEDKKTKTIFIDNPFGAAKDVYIWEPIFEMLKANNVQMIVPARGVTPAITGKFEVNYILGQQMSNGKQLTVVTDYTSKVEQDELEYHPLEYEQVSFDFI